MTIGELAARTAVPTSTIRHWESTGILPKPARAGGKRRYTPEAVHRVALLKLAQACGFSLEEIRRLLHAVDPPAQQVAGRVLDCQCPNLIQCGRMAAAQPPASRVQNRKRKRPAVGRAWLTACPS